MMTGVILAGGKNLRMGQNKALLEVNGQRIIDRTAAILRKMFAEVLLVTNSPLDYLHLGLRTIRDLLPGKGSLGGIYTGLFHAAYEQAFIVACDMPFIQPPLIQYLIDHSPGFHIVIPRTKEGFQPLHAVYSKRCLPLIEDLLHRDILKIIEFFPRVKKQEIGTEEITRLDPQILSFFNINTPEDLDRVRKIVGLDPSMGGSTLPE